MYRRVHTSQFEFHPWNAVYVVYTHNIILNGRNFTYNPSWDTHSVNGNWTIPNNSFVKQLKFQNLLCRYEISVNVIPCEYVCLVCFQHPRCQCLNLRLGFAMLDVSFLVYSRWPVVARKKPSQGTVRWEAWPQHRSSNLPQRPVWKTSLDGSKFR